MPLWLKRERPAGSVFPQSSGVVQGTGIFQRLDVTDNLVSVCRACFCQGIDLSCQDHMPTAGPCWIVSSGKGKYSPPVTAEAAR